MKSYAIDEHRHIIETDYRFPVKGGYQDRIEIDIYEGRIERINVPDLELAIGNTIANLERWILKIEVNQVRERAEKFLNFKNRTEITLDKLKKENEIKRQWSEENADDIYMSYYDRINYTKN